MIWLGAAELCMIENHILFRKPSIGSLNDFPNFHESRASTPTSQRAPALTCTVNYLVSCPTRFLRRVSLLKQMCEKCNTTYSCGHTKSTTVSYCENHTSGSGICGNTTFKDETSEDKCDNC